jgi:pyruvate/2-oxoglutarate dehydrogenase complex dihydrolipoamide acyltransferase (E2) component
MQIKLVQWLIEDGAPVKAGDVLCIIESEKATMEIEAFEPGALRHLKREGDVIVSPDDVPFRIEPA